MTNDVQIIINGRQVPYTSDDRLPLSLSFSVEDGELGKSRGSHSKTQVPLPACAETDALFDTDIAGVRTYPATISAGGVTVFDGTASPEGATLTDGGYKRRKGGYKVGFVGNNASWYEDFQKMPIKDMGLIPVHEITTAFVSANDNPDPDAQAWGYMALLMNDTVQTGGLRRDKLTPFVFIRQLMHEAFRRAGYNFFSQFLESNVGKRLFIPFPQRAHAVDLTGWLAYRVTQGVFDTPPVSNPHFTVPGGGLVDINSLGRYGADGYYTVPADGYYILAVAKSNQNEVYRMRVNGVVQPAYTTPFPLTGTQVGVSTRVFLAAGQRVDLTVVSPTQLSLFTFAIFYAKPDFDTNVVDTFTTINTAAYGNPEWTMADVAAGLAALGIVFDTDVKAGRVVMEARDRLSWGGQSIEGYYTDERDDYTPRIDLLKDGENNGYSRKSRVVYGWKTDSADPNMEQLDDKQAVKVLDGAFDFRAGTFETGVDPVENPFFAKTLHIMRTDLKHSTSTIVPQLPVMLTTLYSEPVEDRGDFLPRLLYFAGRRAGVDGYVKLSDGSAYDPPAAWMVNYNDTTGNDPSLAFGSVRRKDGNTTPGLLQTLLLRHLMRVELGYRVEEWIMWTDLDVMRLNFRRKILLNDRLHILQKLDGYIPGLARSAKTVLIPDAAPTAADVLKISSAAQVGYTEI